MKRVFKLLMLVFAGGLILSISFCEDDPTGPSNTTPEPTENGFPTNGHWTASGIIEPGANITTTFNREMKQSTVENISNYTIEVEGIIIDQISYNNTDKVATFTISYSMYDGQSFTITPKESILDAEDNPLLATVSPEYTVPQFSMQERGPANGWIFYDKTYYSEGWRYLEAAPYDQEYTRWGTNDFAVPGADATLTGSGAQNTMDIVENDTATSKAADSCDTLSIEYNSTIFDDWFLPSRDELYLMYDNLHDKGYGNFTEFNYWSSSEYDDSNAWIVGFTGTFGYQSKLNLNYTRAARAF